MSTATLLRCGVGLWLLSLVMAFLSVDRFLASVAPQREAETDAAFAWRLGQEGRVATRWARRISAVVAVTLALGAGTLCTNAGWSSAALLTWLSITALLGAAFLPVAPVLLRFALRKQFPYAAVHLGSPLRR